MGINRQQTRDSRELRFGRVQRNLEDKKDEDRVRSTLLTLEQDQSEINQTNHEFIKNIESIEQNKHSTECSMFESSYTSFNTNQVLLSIATILIKDINGNLQKCNALLDPGS